MIPSTWKGYWKVSPSLLSSTLSKVVLWTVGYNAFQVALLLLTYGQFRVRWLAMSEGQYLDSYCHFYSYTFGLSWRDLRNTNTSPLFSILMFVSSCTVFNNRAVFNRKRTNYSDQSQQKQTVQWANQNTEQIHVAKRGKMRAQLTFDTQLKTALIVSSKMAYLLTFCCKQMKRHVSN